MKELTGGKDLSSEEKLDILKNQLGSDSKANMEKLMKKKKKLQKESYKKSLMKEVMKHKSWKVSKRNLGSEAEQVIKDMLASGYSIDEALKYVNEHGTETEFEKKMKEMTGGKDLTPEETFDLLKSQLGPESQAKMEAMLKEGKSMEEVVQHFMKYGKTEEQEKQDICRKLNKVLEGG